MKPRAANEGCSKMSANGSRPLLRVVETTGEDEDGNNAGAPLKNTSPSSSASQIPSPSPGGRGGAEGERSAKTFGMASDKAGGAKGSDSPPTNGVTDMKRNGWKEWLIGKGAAFSGSLIVHAAFAAVLLVYGPQAAQKKADTIISMAVHETKREPPKPVEVKPAPKVTPKPKQAPKKAAMKRPQAPPPPNDAPPKKPPAKPPKPVFGVSMNSVVTGGSGGGMAVAVGNTLMAKPDEKFTPPEEISPYVAPKGLPQKKSGPVASYRLTEMPTPKKLIKAAYPREARELGIQGRVRMKLTIDEAGRVIKASVIKGLGHGLDEAARTAALQFLFTPARIGKKPVSTVIAFTYNWEIVD